MATGHQPPSTGENACTANDVELAVRRAAEARECAAAAQDRTLAELER